MSTTSPADPGAEARAAGRPVGRPRDPEVDRAVLDATFEMLTQSGYDGVGIEAVAQAAGVSKNAIYRRWPDKAAMVLDAIRLQAPHRDEPPPDTGDIRADVTALLSAMAAKVCDVDGQLLTSLAADISRHPELADAFRSKVIGPQREAIVARVERAVAAGQLPPDSDVELLVAVGPALLHHRLLIDGVAPDPDYVRRIVEQFWR